MSHAFQNNEIFTGEGLDDWDVSGVKSMKVSVGNWV